MKTACTAFFMAVVCWVLYPIHSYSVAPSKKMYEHIKNYHKLDSPEGRPTTTLNPEKPPVYQHVVHHDKAIMKLPVTPYYEHHVVDIPDKVTQAPIHKVVETVHHAPWESSKERHEKIVKREETKQDVIKFDETKNEVQQDKANDKEMNQDYIIIEETKLIKDDKRNTENIQEDTEEETDEEHDINDKETKRRRRSVRRSAQHTIRRHKKSHRRSPQGEPASASFVKKARYIDDSNLASEESDIEQQTGKVNKRKRMFDDVGQGSTSHMENVMLQSKKDESKDELLRELRKRGMWNQPLKRMTKSEYRDLVVARSPVKHEKLTTIKKQKRQNAAPQHEERAASVFSSDGQPLVGSDMVGPGVKGKSTIDDGDWKWNPSNYWPRGEFRGMFRERRFKKSLGSREVEEMINSGLNTNGQNENGGMNDTIAHEALGGQDASPERHKFKVRGTDSHSAELERKKIRLAKRYNLVDTQPEGTETLENRRNHRHVHRDVLELEEKRKKL